MSKVYSEDGLTFTYPDRWAVEREKTDTGWAVTLSSPESAFAVVRLDRDLPDPDYVAGQALAALRDVYPKLEAAPAVETIAGEMAVGHDVEFFSLDMLNTCWTRTFHGPAGTVFVLCQTTGADSEGMARIRRQRSSATPTTR